MSISSDHLSWLFGIHDYTFKVNTEGISHEESLIRPTLGGNCVNWAVGHLLRSRQWMLTWLGQEWSFPSDLHEFYRRGSSGGDLDKFIPLERLMEMWHESQRLLIEAFSSLTPERLASEAPPLGDFTRPDTLERRILFLYFHESYHLGQLGLMRRLLGKEGAIR